MNFDASPVAEALLRKMQPYIDPRGPDGSGLQVDGVCGMVHTRLAIIDLLGGHQPMSIPARGDRLADGPLMLSFNGEIYNHARLRKKLERLGHRFQSNHCDTEVLLHGYRQWGDQLPKFLHGMFAFAVWDPRRDQLVLVRDRAGKKPLYLYRHNDQLVFGSLVGSILAAINARPTLNQAGLLEYLTFGYTMRYGLLDGLEEVPPGHIMFIRRDGSVEADRYWRPPPLSLSSTRLGAVEAIDELLCEAVTERLSSDVPLGCFLSGGIDSSLIAAIAQKQLKGELLKTFSVSMPEGSYDEQQYAKIAADHIGSNHHVLHASPDIEADLRMLIATVGEPFGDSSLLPTYWLSQATREHVKVALSGDGGDELFGGYDRYRAIRLLGKHGWWIKSLPIGWMREPDGKATSTRVRRLVRAARQTSSGSQYLDMIRLFRPETLTGLGLNFDQSIDQPPDWDEQLDPVEAARRWDLFHYLPYDTLRKVDRASMSVSLEVRCPMLSTQVIDLAGHLPLAVLMPGGTPKGLLRQVAAKYLPQSIIDRKKMGFAIPIGQWFKTDLRAMLRGYLLDMDHLQRLGCHRDTVEQLIEEHQSGHSDHALRLFTLLTLTMWLEWLENPKPPISPSR